MASAKNPTTREVAEDLTRIYEKSFGGKQRGRMRISRVRLRDLSKRGRLEETFLQELTAAALDEGLVLVNLEDYFAVVKADTMRRYRSVTKAVLEELEMEKEEDTQ